MYTMHAITCMLINYNKANMIAAIKFITCVGDLEPLGRATSVRCKPQEHLVSGTGDWVD